MIKVFSETDLPEPMPREQEVELLAKLGRWLSSGIMDGSPQEDMVGALNTGVHDVFREYGLECAYIGPYGIVPGKSGVSNPLIGSVGHGCTDISIYRGVISTAFRLYGEQSIYVPSVKDLERQAPKSHHECRGGEGTPDMAELVLVLPKVHNGRAVAQECLDIDILRVNPFSERGAAELERIVVPHLRTIFPTDISYEPIDGVHVRPE